MNETPISTYILTKAGHWVVVTFITLTPITFPLILTSAPPELPCSHMKDEDQAYKKIDLRGEDVQGKNVLTNFWGMDFTTDKLRSLVRKWQTLIESHVDVETTDSYTLGMFCIGFTKKLANHPGRL
ncbi:hypothetical protein POM88_001445 [Heracleum sosnowskyi]|uniref:40S ribosomal protein S3a n=1 Tax=Heracleum sosnowskyi TaxID=360622 RepID=A0AAD8JC52_9APIA|nr:hypothetical protein POM88_001445 [Heracleum sosnowskyi]